MTARAVWGLVPVKRFTLAKSRLAPVLDGSGRAQLARSMFAHVLETAAHARSLDGVLVVTDDLAAAEMARAAGAIARAETGSSSLGTTIDEALRHLVERGATAAVVLMADLPRLAPDEVNAIVAALDDGDLVVAPDRRDEGINALALPLPPAFATCFGHRDSLARHRAVAQRLRLRLQLHRSPGLAFDVDTPDDLPR